MIKTTPTKVPAIPPPGNSQPELLRTVIAMKEALEVAFARRGDPVDGFVTRRDLVLAGLAQTGNGTGGTLVAGPAVTGGQVVVDVPGTINGLPDNTPPNYGTSDYTPPPVVAGLQVVSMTTSGLMISWDAPNYGNHAYTEIFLVSTADFGSSATTEANFISLSGASFKTSTPCTGTAGTNANKFFRCKPAGSSVVIQLSANDLGGGTGLAGLLNPATWYCFARFVSLAGVPGPFGAPGSSGAAGAPSIDPLAVLDALTKGVQASNVYTDLTAFIGTNPLVVAAGGGVGGIYTNVLNTKDTLSKLYTVQAGTTLPGGNIIAAGFGLGITVDSQTGSASSLFAVNADQFAIMGGGGTYSPISNFQSASGTVGTFTVLNGNQFPDISSAFNAWNQATPIGNPPIVVIKSQAALVNGVQTDPFDGIEATVTGITGNKITCTINTPSTQTTPNTWPPFSSGVPKFICLATNIPFIVDTATQTVGIRGRLVVDGLIRATTGDFNTLTANNAFINSLRANIINANIVCGQSIIAGSGIPPNVIVNGTISQSALATVDAWIVQLSKPGPGGFPFQIYNPARQNQPGGVLLSLFGGLVDNVTPANTQFPYMLLQGDIRIGGGATFNLRKGGAIAMGNTSNDNIAYTLWAGADLDYNTTAANMESKGFLWIRPSTLAEQAVTGSTAQGGFNLDLFLGKNALTLPNLASQNQAGSSIYQDGTNGPRAQSLVTTGVTSSALTVRSLKGGAPAQTMVQVNGYLASCPTAGPGQGNFKRFKMVAQLVTDPTATTGTVIQSIEMDDYSPEAWDFNLMGIVTVGPGNYWVRIDVTNIEDRPMSIVQGWNAVAMQITSNGGLA